MNSKIRVLIAEDEAPIRKFLRAGLAEEQYAVVEASSGKEAITAVATHNPDIILLDLGLPDMDGLVVIKELRSWTTIPIIVLSAREIESDKVEALDSGADDYLTKPFSVVELKARIRVAIRNSQRAREEAGESVFSTTGLRVDFSQRQVFVRDVETHLTPIEFNLLSLMIRHRGKVLTHRQLLCTIWGDAYARETQYLRVFMGQLRRKIESDPSRPKLLTTESGIGYRFKWDGIE